MSHHSTPGDTVNLIVTGIVPSGLEQCTTHTAGHGGPGAARTLARWRLLYTCSEIRRERLASKSQKNKSGNNNQLPQNIFKLKMSLLC